MHDGHAWPDGRWQMAMPISILHYPIHLYTMDKFYIYSSIFPSHHRHSHCALSQLFFSSPTRFSFHEWPGVNIYAAATRTQEQRRDQTGTNFFHFEVASIFAKDELAICFSMASIVSAKSLIFIVSGLPPSSTPLSASMTSSTN